MFVFFSLIKHRLDNGNTIHITMFCLAIIITCLVATIQSRPESFNNKSLIFPDIIGLHRELFCNSLVDHEEKINITLMDDIECTLTKWSKINLFDCNGILIQKSNHSNGCNSTYYIKLTGFNEYKFKLLCDNQCNSTITRRRFASNDQHKYTNSVELKKMLLEKIENYESSSDSASDDDTAAPTSQPTFEPTYQPSPQPTYQPSPQPTYQPSPQPTFQPTFQPSPQPTFQPTFQPTQPTLQPIKAKGDRRRTARRIISKAKKRRRKRRLSTVNKIIKLTA